MRKKYSRGPSYCFPVPLWILFFAELLLVFYPLLPNPLPTQSSAKPRSVQELALYVAGRLPYIHPLLCVYVFFSFLHVEKISVCASFMLHYRIVYVTFVCCWVESYCWALWFSDMAIMNVYQGKHELVSRRKWVGNYLTKINEQIFIKVLSKGFLVTGFFIVRRKRIFSRFPNLPKYSNGNFLQLCIFYEK